jgi:hypothetical protein
LYKLKINSSLPLIIETKTDEEEFEEYDPYWLNLRVVRFVEGLDGDQSTLECILANSIMISVHRQKETIGDLERKVADSLGVLTAENLVVLLRHETFVSAKTGSSVRSEVYNLSWRKVKIIDEGPKLDSFSDMQFSVTQGILYVEEGDCKDKADQFKWHKEFNKAFD